MPTGRAPAPEPKGQRIATLIQRIQSGDIKIPKFQRGFIWDESQIIRLLESIYQGYPIGSLLFWLTETPMKSEKDIGGFDLPKTPDKYPRNYVLDGQQRLTTIYGVLNWPKSQEIHKLNVYFDLDTLSFHHYYGKESNRYIPLNILNSSSAFLNFQREKLYGEQDEKELIERANVLWDTFREYEIPVVTIYEKTIKEVCPIFERINSSGTQLNVFDLMVAATWSDDFDLNDQISKIRESTKLKDFDEIDNRIYLKIMASVADIGSKEHDVMKLRELSAENLVKLAEKVQESVEKAVDFLSTGLSVPSDAFLPYQYQLVVYSYFFSKVRNPTVDQINVLKRFFWQSGFSEHYRGAAEGVLEHDLSGIDKLIEGDLDALKLPLYLTREDLLERPFVKRGALTKTFAVLLASKSPMNITNGENIDTKIALSGFNSKEFHHIFPIDYLKKLGYDASSRNNICNICLLSSSQNKVLLNTAPSDYLVKSAMALKDQAKNVFESNLISFAEDAPWKNNDFKTFLAERASTIYEEIKRNW